jgi:hypothetical protein
MVGINPRKRACKMQALFCVGILFAVTELNKTFDAQVLNYLNATGYETGLLINFGESSLKHHRIFNACRNNPYNP